MDEIDNLEAEMEKEDPEAKKQDVQRLLHKLDNKDYAADDSDADSDYSLYQDEECLNSPIQGVDEV